MSSLSKERTPIREIDFSEPYYAPFLNKEAVEFSSEVGGLTTARLAQVYKFSQDVVCQEAALLGRPVTTLDIGTWKGLYLKYLMELPQVSQVHAIDINPEHIRQVAKREELQEDLVSNRLNLYLMDGTQMAFAANSFDAATSIEVLVGLQGRVNKLFREMARVLRPGGVAIVTYANRAVHSPIKQMAFELKEEAYKKSAIKKSISRYFGRRVKVDWYGQLPALKGGGGITYPDYHSTKNGKLTVDQGLIQVRALDFYQEINEPLKEKDFSYEIIPTFMVAVIKKL